MSDVLDTRVKGLNRAFRSADAAGTFPPAPRISTGRDLARRMAGLTRLIRHAIVQAIAHEPVEALEKGRRPDGMPLHQQLAAFRQVLVHDLSADDFADMYAQTICYGLVAARFEGVEDGRFTIGGVASDARVARVVDDLAEVLNRTDMHAVRKAFRAGGRDEDPVVEFYEDFLAAYAPDIRNARGVYYTPAPVVGFMVRSVDLLLKTRFGLADGLADTSQFTADDGKKHHKVQILDPAAGTGTFLHAVVRHLRRRHFAGNEGMWPGYVREHLLPRLHGFELLMAPYTIAHLKLNLVLEDGTGRERGGRERVNVFLTNALEEPHGLDGPPLFAGWLADEALAAGTVKRDAPVMVVLGNPPYSGHSSNPSERRNSIAKGSSYEKYGNRHLAPKTVTATKDLTATQRTFIGHLLHGWDPLAKKATGSYFHVDGEPLGEKNPKWLNNDYVKFIRFGQWRIERTGQGVLAYVTANSFLDGPIHRAMRRSLMQAFDEIFIVNLHGNANRKETAPDGGRDENVFDIAEGVAVIILAKHPGGGGRPATVRYADLWGERAIYDDPGAPGRTLTGGKYHWLDENDLGTVHWRTLAPKSPGTLLVPRDRALEGEYEAGWSLAEAMPVHSLGIVTARDRLNIHFDEASLRKSLTKLRELPTEEAREELRLGPDVQDWSVARAQRDLADHPHWEDCGTAILYRPFDNRVCHFTGRANGLMCRPRRKVMGNFVGFENLGLVTTSQTKDPWDVLVTRSVTGHKAVSAYDSNSVFPLYVFPDGGGRRPNLAPGVLADFEKRLSLRFIAEGRGDLAATFGPEDVFHYVYALLQAPSYRNRYREFLEGGFPRIPVTANGGLFKALCGYGDSLAGAHLMRTPGSALPGFPVAGDNRVEKPRYTPPSREAAGRVWINPSQYFEGVPTAIWNYRMGGYQVCEKWLKDRKGRTLGHDALEHYRGIVAALDETLGITEKIDAAIEEHGGWPIQEGTRTP